MNSLKGTVIPQMENAKRRAKRLHELGRVSSIDVFLFTRKADQMIQFLEEMIEEEVQYGEALGDQAGQ